MKNFNSKYLKNLQNNMFEFKTSYKYLKNRTVSELFCMVFRFQIVIY